VQEITYGSVCSGIEAATTAWHPLGWSPRWFAEIEPFPSAVLAHHWPEVPNLGDFTLIRDKIAEGAVEAPDVLVGGTPCQAFSVAGLRQSLDDKRGQLTLEFVRLADAIDHVRIGNGKRPLTIVWENVPGVLSTPDNAFGCFLGALAGEDVALIPPGGKWTNAGRVLGPTRAVAWRILDAQYFGVAQRRRRVFVVASARDGFDPRQVLFEFDGVRRDSPPRREAGKGFASVAGTLAANGGGTTRPAGNANELDFCVPVAPTIQASGKAAGSATQQDAESGALVVQAFDGYNQAIGDVAQAIRSNKSDGDHVGMVFYAATQHHGKVEADVAGPITRQQHQGITGDMPIVGHVQAVAATGEVFHTLRAEAFDASEDGTGRGAGAVAVAFSSKDYGADASEGLAPTMRTMGHDRSRANGGGQLAVACFKGGQGSKSRGIGYSEHIAPTLSACPSGTQLSPTLMQGMQVRRITPTECERLQGFPDGHTRIPWKLGYWPAGSCSPEAREALAEQCPDGPRYKALGNSMAVPVMRWIGARIARELKVQA